MIAFGNRMGGGVNHEPLTELTVDDIVSLLEQQHSFDVSELSTALGLTDFLFLEIVPPESALVLTGANSPEMISISLDIAPPEGRAIHDCAVFFITLNIAGIPAGTRIINLESGKIGSSEFGVDEAQKFQKLLDAVSRADAPSVNS